jgi:hypothetical protein
MLQGVAKVIEASAQRALCGEEKVDCHPERSEGSVWAAGACHPTTPIPRYARNDITIRPAPARFA